MMDTPYSVRCVVRESFKTHYQIFHTSDGHVLTAHNFETARKAVEALNKQELERAVARVA
jgi:hypothetical protein